MAHSRALAIGVSRGPLFDLSQAPTVMGPRTQTIAATLVRWERVRKPVGVVTSDNTMQRLQWERIVREHVVKTGRVFTAEPAVLSWAGSRTAIGGQPFGRDE